MTIKDFTKDIRKYNNIEYLKNIIQNVNAGRGYVSLAGKHVIFNTYLIGKKKIDRDIFIENKQRGIIHF